MEQKDDMRRLMIGAPLLLVVVFCFGFFLVHPRISGGVDHSTATEPTSYKKDPTATSSSLSQLAPLPLAKTTLPTMTPAAAVDDSSTPDTTASSQSAGSSSAASKASTYKTGKAGSAPAKTSHNGLIPTVVNGLVNGL